MAKYSVLQTFYASDAWRNLRLCLIMERGLTCEHCGLRVGRAEELTGHHVIELTPDNVMDASIALNPANIMIVHHGCHNDIHRRAAHRTEGRAAYLVFGAPLAGKHSLVRDRMWPGDLVVDMDMLYTAVSGQPLYTKPDSLLANVKNAYNLLLDNVKTRCGRWDRAWVIGGYPETYKREAVANSIGAEIVFVEASKEKCLERLRQDTERKTHYDEWAGYIDRWFESYTA
jgi:hypothetical protein